MAYSPLSKHCIQLKNPNGKPVGLMVEGSTNYMSALEASKGLMNNPDIKEGGDIIDKTAQKDSAPKQDIKEIKSKASQYKPVDKRGVGNMNHDGVPMKHDGMPMKHDGVPMKHHDSAMPMEHKGMSMKYDSPTPMHGPFHAGHDDDSPAMFTGMSGGSALPELEMIKVNGKMVPKYAADGKGPNDLLKNKK